MRRTKGEHSVDKDLTSRLNLARGHESYQHAGATQEATSHDCSLPISRQPKKLATLSLASPPQHFEGG